MLRSFLSDRKGSIASLMGVAAIPLAVATGTAVDYALVAKQQVHLQDALDAAVIAGAVLATNLDSERIEEVERIFAANFPAIHRVVPVVSVDGSQVTGTASMPVPMAFMGIIGVDTFPIDATSVALSGDGGPICMLALNPDEPWGLRLEGNPTLLAENCWVYANSSDPAGMETVGISDAEAAAFCVVGGYQGNGFTPSPYTGCWEKTDPFSHLRPPADLGCDYYDTVFQNETVDADPGVYCGGMLLRAHADVTLSPGTYVIKDGDLELLAHSSLTGENVTFYFVGSNTRLEIHSHSDIDVTAPDEAGDYPGFVFIQDAGSSAGETSVMAGGDNVRIVGMGYFPTQILDIRGESGFNVNSDHLALVADKFRIRGNGNIHVRVDPNAPGYDLLAEARLSARLLQ